MATKATTTKTAKDKKTAAQRPTRGRDTTAKTAKAQTKTAARPATRAVAKSTAKQPAKRASAPATKPAAKAPAKTVAEKAPRKEVTSAPRKAASPATAARAKTPAAQAPMEKAAPPATVAAEGTTQASSAAPAAPKPAAADTSAAPAQAVAKQPPAAPAPAAPPPSSATAAKPAAEPSKAEPAAAPAPAIEFAVGDHVVYPTHGVGRVTGIVTEEIAGHRLTLIVVEFEDNRMVLRVPVAKAKSAGLRKLSSRKAIEQALATLKGRARIKRTMWSRRAQEYEAKINSGDPVAIAEVVRDLHRNAGQPDQSFSERQIYEQALDRLAAELAAIEQVDKATAAAKLASYLKAA